MANIIDSLVSYVAPEAALRRAQARKVLSHYEAAQPSRLRKNRNTNPSPNLLVGRSASALRNHARYLERNHDITRGVLRTLVNNVVGPNGIGIEPQPRRRDGTIHKEYADQLRQLHRQWSKAPEVTGRMHWAQAERMAAYTWLRDGELFAQQVVGNAPGLVHGSKVPFSLELLEPDFVPLDFTDLSRKVRQGIQVNDWVGPWPITSSSVTRVSLVPGSRRRISKLFLRPTCCMSPPWTVCTSGAASASWRAYLTAWRI